MLRRSVILLVKKIQNKGLKQLDIHEATSREIHHVMKRIPNIKRIYFDISKSSIALAHANEWRTILKYLLLLENIKEIQIKCTNDSYVNPIIQGIDDAIDIISSCLQLCETISKNQLNVFIMFSRWCKMFQQDIIFQLISKIKKQFSINYKFQISIQFDCCNLLEIDANKLAIKYDLFIKNNYQCKACFISFTNETKDILNCNACQASFHSHCLKSSLTNIFYSNTIWFCHLCCPTYQKIPIKFSKDKLKLSPNNEPLLKDLKLYLKQYPFLECDLEPQFHKPLFTMKKISIPSDKPHCGKAPRIGTNTSSHCGISLNWGRK